MAAWAKGRSSSSQTRIAEGVVSAVSSAMAQELFSAVKSREVQSNVAKIFFIGCSPLLFDSVRISLILSKNHAI